MGKHMYLRKGLHTVIKHIKIHAQFMLSNHNKSVFILLREVHIHHYLHLIRTICLHRKIKIVNTYVSFMDRLVNTLKDVELLHQKGIINNYLSNGKAVSVMMKKMGDYVPQSKNSYYASISCEVNKHCKKRWNRWTALLLRDHGHSFHFFAAIALLVLTLYKLFML